MIVEIDNVELYFKEKRILSGIYLKAQTGKITGVLGSNGCGKSCLLNIVFGSLKPKYKLVRLNGKPILKPLYQTKKVAYLPQQNFVPKSMKLSVLFKMFEVNWYDFIIYFDSFKSLKNYRFGKLSGGERRIIETYIILRSKRDIVLLDEPFSHLAPIQIETIKSIILEEKHHKAIVITDHLYSHILEMSDDIYLIKDGHSKLIQHREELEFYKYINLVQD